ncbi:hypothetical protein [Lysinibacillus parviboronicapiens]|uniref:hypothetical protein n=1 Tax=Lysinibacillus parviboronicapiens TaxID=436516 RepID=UPI000D3C1B41|nr:hypothetical protein [Lysinibacillus parviboronicapiens]
MTFGGWMILTFAIVCYLPFFIWLAASYLNKSKRDNNKRQNTFWALLVIMGLINSINTFYFNINDTYSFAITISVILLFSLYMLIIVLKDKGKITIG